jgi:N-acetylneuraminic acid mutarotase
MMTGVNVGRRTLACVGVVALGLLLTQSAAAVRVRAAASSQGAAGSFRAAPPDVWSSLPAMHDARANPSAIWLEDRVIVVGGFDTLGTALSSVEAYDLNYNRWIQLAPMPTSLGDTAISFHGVSTKVDVFGGAGSRGEANAQVQQYHSDTNTWVLLTMLPQPRRGLAVAHGLLPGYEMMVAGGIGPGKRVLSSVLQFNAWKHTWSPLPAMHTARYDFGLVPMWKQATDTTLIYAIGGFGADHKPLRSVEAYNVSTRRWTVMAPLPQARGGLSATDLNGTIVVAGGTGPNGKPVAGVERYTPATGKWTALGAMPAARTGPALVDTSNSPRPGLFVVGGRGSGGNALAATTIREAPFPEIWSLDTPLPSIQYNLGAVRASDGTVYAWARDGTRGFFAFDTATHTWTVRASLPSDAVAVSLVAGADGSLYSVGGTDVDAGKGISTVERYDPSTNAWSPRAPMPVARSDAAGVMGSDGKIYVTGGSVPDPSEGDNTLYRRGLEIYDPATNRWTSGAPMPTAREGLGMAVMPGGKIAAIGGSTSHYQRTTCWNRVEVYDPATNRWTTGPALTATFCRASVTTGPDGTIYAVMVTAPERTKLAPPGTIESLAPGGASWHVIGQNPLFREGAGSTLGPDGAIYIIGGEDADVGGTATVERFSIPPS